jgi:hypothetical protein
MAKFTPKWVIRGPNSPQMVQKRPNFKIFKIRPLIARSKNLAKADLMSPPPELFFFFVPLNRPVSSGLTGRAQLSAHGLGYGFGLSKPVGGVEGGGRGRWRVGEGSTARHRRLRKGAAARRLHAMARHGMALGL